MNIPLPRNIYTITTTSPVPEISIAGVDPEKLSDARKTRLTVGGEVLSKQVLSFSNTDAKKAELKSLEEPLFPPGVGFDIPAPFRDLKLSVKINDMVRKGTFDDLVGTCCSKRSNKAVRRFTKKAHLFPDLQGLIDNKRDSVAWNRAIRSFVKSLQSVPEVENYKIIVEGLCSALQNAKPGKVIAGSEIIKPEEPWNEEEVKRVAAVAGIDLSCIYATKYEGRIPHVSLAIQSTKNEVQLREFMLYMKEIFSEVPFLTECNYTAFPRDKNKRNVCEDLNDCERALYAFSPTELPFSDDVMAFRDVVVLRCDDIRMQVEQGEGDKLDFAAISIY